MADYGDDSQYGGLDPSLVSYLQGGGGQPPQQQIATPEWTALGAGLPPPPPPPPPTQKVGAAEYAPPVIVPPPVPMPTQRIGPSPSDETPAHGLDPAVAAAIQNGAPAPSSPDTSGLSPAVTSAIQNGLPSALSGQTASAPDLVVPRQPLPESVIARIATPSDAQIAQQNAAYAKQQAAQAAFEASPEGIAQKADVMRAHAIAQQEASDRAQAEADKTYNDAAARIQADYNTRSADQAKTDAANERAYQADRQKLIQQRTQQVKDWSAYKVDTDRDYGVGGLIAIALSGIGAALDHRHGPNTALQIMDASIDKRINDAYRQKDELKGAVSMTDSQLDTIARSSRDRREAEALSRAALLQDQANQLKSAALSVANPQVAARAQALAAQRESERATLIDGVATRHAQQLKDTREAQQQAFSNRLQLAHLGVAEEQLGFEKKKWQDQIDAAKLAAKQAGNTAQAAQADKVRNEGVFDPRTAAPLLDPQGRAKAQQADQLEAASRLARDPAQAQRLQQQASQLRQDATLNNSYTIKDAADRGKLREAIGANQGLVDVIADIDGELAKGPSGFDRTTWAALKSKFEVAKADYIAAHAGKLTSREMDAIGEAFSADPDSIWSREAGVGKMRASLGALKQYAVADATRALRGAGIDDKWEPRATVSAPAETLSSKTAAEAAQAATPGSLVRAIGPGTTDLGVQKKTIGARIFGGESDPTIIAELRAPFSSSGLAPDDEKRVRAEMDRFALGARAEGAIRDKVANLDTLPAGERSRVLEAARSLGSDREAAISRLAAFAASPREALSSGVIALLRERPDLYREVLARLPEDQQHQLRQADLAAEDARLGIQRR